MVSTFGSINEVGGGGVPQFQQVPTAQGDTGEGVLQATELGQSIFRSIQESGQAKAEMEQQSALGGLHSKLANIRQAGTTNGSVNVVAQQRRVYNQFLLDHPASSDEAAKAFKASTGMAPGGMSPEETKALNLRAESIGAGWGDWRYPPEVNQKLQDQYMTFVRKDKMHAFNIREAQDLEAQGKLAKGATKEKVLTGAQDMFSGYVEKTTTTMRSVATLYDSGELTREQVLSTIAGERAMINKGVATLGEYSTDPVITVYKQPALDVLQILEDHVMKAGEKKSFDAMLEEQKRQFISTFVATPSGAAYFAANQVNPNVAGTQAGITARTLEVIQGGLNSPSGDNQPGTVPEKSAPVNFTGLNDDEQDVVIKTITNLVAGGKDPSVATEEVKQTGAASITGIAEFLNRNGDFISKEEKDFSLKVLQIPGAIESLNPKQRELVMEGLDKHVVDVVNVEVDKSITNATLPVTYPLPGQPSPAGFKRTQMQEPMAKVADLEVREGVIQWKLKPQYRGVASAEIGIKKVNEKIAKDITPTVGIMSKGLEVQFEEYAATKFQIQQTAPAKPERVNWGEAATGLLESDIWEAPWSKGKEKLQGGKGETKETDAPTVGATDTGKVEAAPRGELRAEQAMSEMTTPAVDDPATRINEARLIQHMEEREGVVLESYKDSLQKLTGGIGHLLTKAEQKKYPEGTAIPKEVVDAWFVKDLAKAKKAAAAQAKKVPVSTPEFEEALVSMNFQLGTEWTTKFPTAWENMQNEDFIGAARELEFTSEGSGVESKWYEQTPKRVEDAKAALVQLEVAKQMRGSGRR